MSIQEVEQLSIGDSVNFAGILSTKTRQGKFVRIVNEYLVGVDYGDHTEQNHITNLFLKG